MKSILAVAVMTAFVVAEVPSNSYLPPPPNRGYPQTSPPSVIAARTLDLGADQQNGNQYGVAGTANGFARSNFQNHDHAGHAHGAQTRFNNNEDQGYDQNSASFRNALEEINSTVSYNGDERGYKSQTSYEDSEDIVRSGYDASSNNIRANNGYQGNGQDGGQANGRSNGYN